MEQHYTELVIVLISGMKEPIDWESKKLNAEYLVKKCQVRIIKNLPEEEKERLPEEFLNRVISMQAASGKKNFTKQEFVSYLKSYWL